MVLANEESTPPTALIKLTESDDRGVTWSAPGRLVAQPVRSMRSSRRSRRGRTARICSSPGRRRPGRRTGPRPGLVWSANFAAFQVRTNGFWGGAHLISTAFGDPDGSSTNSLRAQFLGDYASAVASNTRGWFVWTDTRNETACAAVDAFRSGTAGKPNPDTACPASTRGQLFRHSDIFVGAVGF